MWIVEFTDEFEEWWDRRSMSIPADDDIYDEYLNELREEGLIE